MIDILEIGELTWRTPSATAITWKSLVRYIKDDIIELVYLDPPFKSNQNYYVLFKEQDGTPKWREIKK